MKHGTTTPVSVLSTKRLSLVTLAVMMTIAMPLSMSLPTSAESISQLNAKIDALNRQKAEYQSKAKSLDKKADTLSNKVASLQVKERKLQSQIDLSQARYEKLQKQIADTKKQIKENQRALNETVVDMYIAGDMTPLEMLASSKNIGDFIDQQAYQSSINSQLTAKINKISKLKKDLESQKQDVKIALNEQKNSRSELASTRAEQQSLLSQTRGKESSYRKLVKKTDAARQKIADEIARKQLEVIRSGQGTVISTVGGNGYPYQCYVDGAGYSAGVDGHGYGCSQCVSYAAWMMSQHTNGRLYPNHWGNADMFPGNAAAEGYHVSYQPHKNSIVFFPPGVNGAPAYNYDGSPGVGHVAWVEGVSGDGKTIIVSQYNYNTGSGNGKFSRMSFPVYGGMQFIYP